MRVAAFFDMDKTLLRCNSGALWARYLRRRGEISLYETVRAFVWILQYKFALLDFESVTRRLAADMKGQPEVELAEKCRQWVGEELVRPAAEGPPAPAKAGRVVALLCPSWPYGAEPLAHELALDAVLCTRLEVQAGKFTGRVLPPVCFGAGKVTWAEQFAVEHDID